jgi:predicted transcriptional regulator
VLSVVKTLMEEQEYWWEVISAEQQTAIDKAFAEMKAGKLTPHDELIKKYKKWLKK